MLGPTPNGANGFNADDEVDDDDDDDNVNGAEDFLSTDFGSGLVLLLRMGVEWATGAAVDVPPTRYGSCGLTSVGSGSKAYGLDSFSTRNDFVAGLSLRGFGAT